MKVKAVYFESSINNKIGAKLDEVDSNDIDIIQEHHALIINCTKAGEKIKITVPWSNVKAIIEVV